MSKIAEVARRISDNCWVVGLRKSQRNEPFYKSAPCFHVPKPRDLSFIADIFNWFEKPDGMTPRYMSGQHYWEVGMREFRIRDLVRRFSGHFEVLDTYRNHDWLPSQNFILKSRRAGVR